MEICLKQICFFLLTHLAYRATYLLSSPEKTRGKVNKKIKSAKREHYYIQYNNFVNSKNRWNKLKRLGIGKYKQQSEVDFELIN